MYRMNDRTKKEAMHFLMNAQSLIANAVLHIADSKDRATRESIAAAEIELRLARESLILASYDELTTTTPNAE